MYVLVGVVEAHRVHPGLVSDVEEELRGHAVVADVPAQGDSMNPQQIPERRELLRVEP